jgi:mono/diheme cytochrome c family protein
MNKTPVFIFAAVVVVVAAIGWLLFSKEGSEKASAVPVESEDKQAQEMFATNCGTCHTLAAAGTDGVVGPNLDEILPTQVAPPEGTAEEVADANLQAYDGAYGRVLTAVVCGLGGRMPAGILQDADAQEVSGFVAAYAGQFSEDQGPLVPADERETPAPDECATGGLERGGSEDAANAAE